MSKNGVETGSQKTSEADPQHEILVEIVQKLKRTAIARRQFTAEKAEKAGVSVRTLRRMVEARGLPQKVRVQARRQKAKELYEELNPDVPAPDVPRLNTKATATIAKTLATSKRTAHRDVSSCRAAHKRTRYERGKARERLSQPPPSFPRTYY